MWLENRVWQASLLPLYEHLIQRVILNEHFHFIQSEHSRV